MEVGDAHVFSGFLTPVLTQLFFPKPPTTFLTCFCRGERQKYAGKKSHLNQGSNSQPPGHESDTLTTEPPRRGRPIGSRLSKTASCTTSMHNQCTCTFKVSIQQVRNIKILSTLYTDGQTDTQTDKLTPVYP